MINGIPVSLKGENGAIEKPVFATARKCPALLGKLKDITKADTAETVAARRARDAEARIGSCTAEELDAVAVEAEGKALAAQAASVAVMDAVHEFLLAGFAGAGYTPEQAEYYTSLIGPERLQELKAKCLLGSGVVDFSPAGA